MAYLVLLGFLRCYPANLMSEGEFLKGGEEKLWGSRYSTVEVKTLYLYNSVRSPTLSLEVSNTGFLDTVVSLTTKSSTAVGLDL
jgi:hypothetical protein